MRHALPLGQVLSNQTIGVFVRASFPGMMRCGKVEPSLRLFLDGREAMKLRPVVGRDRSHGAQLVADQLRCPLVHFRRRSRPQLPE